MTDFNKITFTGTNILKIISILSPIIGAILYGYLNIMTKLTQLEFTMIDNNKFHLTVEKEIDVIKTDEVELRKLLNQHINNIDDTKIYKNYEKIN